LSVLYLDGGDDIKLDLKEISLEGTDWIYVAEDSDKWQAVVNVLMNI